MRYKTKLLGAVMGVLFTAALAQNTTGIPAYILKNSEKEIYQNFLITTRVPMRQAGEKFPSLQNLQSKEVFSPNGWSLIVVGGATCKTCDQIQFDENYKKLKFSVHHFSDGKAGQDKQPYTRYITDSLGESYYNTKGVLGIVAAPGYFIVSPNKSIIFSRYSYMGSTTPLEEIKSAISKLANKDQVFSESVLKPRTPLALKPGLKSKLDSLFKSKGTRILFFSEEQCDICRSGAATFKSDLEKLRIPGVSIAYVQVGSGLQEKVSTKTLTEVLDPQGVTSSLLQVTRWPQAVVLRDGRYMGRVDYAKILIGDTERGDDTPFFLALKRAAEYVKALKL